MYNNYTFFLSMNLYSGTHAFMEEDEAVASIIS
jgi:hypothetical protein